MITERLEAARHAPQFVVFAAPPRHAKTETVLHGIACDFAFDPTLQVGYASYSQAIALTKARRARSLTRAAGLTVGTGDASDAASEWETSEGGSLRSDGILGSWTGRGFKRLHIDDPFKNRLEAESPVVRERVYEGWRSDLRTRVEPGGSVFVYATRWHPEDLSGRLIKDGFEEVVLPALDENDVPLWPERWPYEALVKLRKDVGEYAWASLFQGRPRPRGGTLFGPAHTYEPDALPRSGLVYSVGIDGAFSRRTHADYSIAITLAREMVPANGTEQHYRWYVLDVVRKQCQAPEWAEVLRATYARHPTALRRWYTGGQEVGIADLFRSMGIRVGDVPAGPDKFIRAQPVAAQWNAGNVLVPADAPWLDAFIAELSGFTGVSDTHDDQVDALAAAFDVLTGPTDTDVWTGGPQRETAGLRQGSGLRGGGW